MWRDGVSPSDCFSLCALENGLSLLCLQPDSPVHIRLAALCMCLRHQPAFRLGPFGPLGPFRPLETSSGGAAADFSPHRQMEGFRDTINNRAADSAARLWFYNVSYVPAD